MREIGIAKKDFRIFKDNRSRDWIICNDYLYRSKVSKGISKRQAKKKSHGHLRTKRQCKTVKSNILSNKRPKTRNNWILGCYVRVTDDTYKYHDWVKGLYETRIGKSNNEYYNVGGGMR